MRALYLGMLCILLSLTLQAQNTCAESPVPPGSDELTLSHLSSFATGVFDGAAAEIVAYDAASQQLFFTNADDNSVTVLSIADPANPTKVMDIDMSPYGGGINSVAVHDGLIAAAVQAETVDGNGTVVIFDANGTIISTTAVGVLPDMITFAQNGTKLLTANEGEPSSDYLTDPLGSVSIIDLATGSTTPSVITVDFTSYDDRRHELINKGVRFFGPGASVGQDLEPEYITVTDDSIAYVSLQENNAFALVNINTGAIVDIQALGYKNHAAGQPKLTEYVINELIDMPELGTPTYGGGQPPVKLGGFSGMYFDAAASTASEYVFYAVPDRGPNDAPVSSSNVIGGNPTNLRPFKLPNYQGRIARFTLNTISGAISLDEQIMLTRQDGTTPISGRGNIPGVDETPVVPADAVSTPTDLLNVDFEDGSLLPFTAVDLSSTSFWVINNFSGSDNYAEMNGFGADAVSDDWLISPAIDLVRATSATLNFESTANFGGPDIKVLVSSDYDPATANPDAATWTDITAEATLSPGDFADTQSGDVDLSDFEGQVVYLAFQYISTGTASGDGKVWQLDNIVVRADVLENDFVDNAGNTFDALEFDEFGGDFESIVRDDVGNFWMCDEYRPAIYAFSPNGILIDRFVPQGTSMLGLTPQPVGTYGSETLPAVYASRRANRGFEGMALNTDDGLLYAFIQSPIENPNSGSVRNASNVIRVLAITQGGVPVAEYVYLLENNANRAYDIGRVDKIGDVVYAGNGKFMVLERDSSVPGQDEGKKYVFEITLTGATNILSLPISTQDGTSGPALEEMTADELVAAGVQPLHKTKVLNLPSIGYLPSDKPEGIAVLPGGAIAVLNDNDFGLAGAGVSDNSTLGIIDFCNDNGFDASNRDDTISITTHPTLGMYMPDAIASYTVGDRSYIVSANEGDSRDYDAFSEETRVSDLTLDPVAYPNAVALQEDDNLGRLKTTTATGDIDGDGDIDQIYSYGARSFSIWDRYGNLVFDSGNEFERILADKLPSEFNSGNDENDSFDDRSDDKGPEPEAVEIFTKGDQTYALIGLERMGGIMVYNITDPLAPSYVSYVNNRNFDVEVQLEDDSSNPVAGDLGVEDVIYIPADQSPDGMELVVTSNEVSGTISIFGVNRVVNEALTLQILHNNDGESKIVADTLEDGRAFGGADRFLTVLEDLRATDTPTITLSSGDNYLPGQAFNASLARAEGLPLYDSEVLDAIGYDALVIGNHDFDFGPDILQRVIEETSASSPTFLSANLDFTAEPGLQALADAGRIAKSEIVTTGGQQIGVVGLTTISLPTISTPRGVRVDSNLVSVAQSEIDALLAAGINKIILISHLQGIDEELMLAAELTGVDVIIAGGGDELLTNDPTNALGGLTVDDTYPRVVQDAGDNDVYVVTTPGEYRYVGNLTVDFDAEGNITAIADDSDVVPVVGDIDGMDEITAIVDSINAFTADLAANVIAVTEVDLDGLRTSVRSVETNEGNLITDAYLWYYNEVAADFDFDETIPVVAMQNGGGIRDDEVIPAGSNISEAKTFDILPFSNFVSVTEPISAETFKSVLENSVSRVEFGDGRFSQVAGFELVYDTTGVADESRVVSVTLDDGTAIVENGAVVAGAPDVYVVTNSFTAGGGDDYEDFAATTFRNIGPSYQRVLFDYLVAENGANGVVTAEQYPTGGEGRIRLLEPAFTLRILHNNDGESKIVADTLMDGTAFGGAARFVSVVDELRTDAIPTLTLSSGDNFLPGSAFNASLARPDGSLLYDSEVLNAIGYDALVIGNHDFDFGPDILQRVIEETATSDATFLSANLNFTAEPGLQALVASERIATRKVVERDGERIGIVGLTTPSLPTVSSPRGVVVDSNLMGIAQQEIDLLMADGVNKIILISHLQSINEELMLAGELTDVDVIIAGGGDELLTNDPANELGGLTAFDEYPIKTVDANMDTVYIVTTPGEYRYVGNLVVEFDEMGRVTAIDEVSDVVPVLGDAPRDATIVMTEDSILAYTADLDANIIARTEVALDGLRASIRTAETNEGNLIADAYLYLYGQRREEFGFDPLVPVIAMQNGGGIRNDEVIPADSDISEGKTFDILPFSNFVSVLNPLTPAQLKSALENSFSNVENVDGRFSQIGGFAVKYDTLGVAGESRVFEVKLDDGTLLVQDYTVVEGAPSVYVVTNSFSAGGGDGYDEFAAAGFTNIGPSYQQALFTYLTATDGLNGVITAEDYPEGGEGRIMHRFPVSTNDLDLTAYQIVQGPNPFGPGFNLSYQLPEAGEINISLVDLNGRVLRTLADGRQPAGVRTMEVAATGLPAGMYFLRFRIGERVGALHLVKK